MTALKNHPAYWLREAAAASLDRMEAARGRPFSISSAGRTVEEQQGLINLWNAGGKYARPPYLYQPASPAAEGPHVKNGGAAVDINDADDRAWIRAHGGEYGWRFNLSWDIVHMIYEDEKDQHKNAPLANSTPSKNPAVDVVAALQKAVEMGIPIALTYVADDGNLARALASEAGIEILSGPDTPQAQVVADIFQDGRLDEYIVKGDNVRSFNDICARHLAAKARGGFAV